jgi:hypothetical protein
MLDKGGTSGGSCRVVAGLSIGVELIGKAGAEYSTTELLVVVEGESDFDCGRELMSKFPDEGVSGSTASGEIPAASVGETEVFHV